MTNQRPGIRVSAFTFAFHSKFSLMLRYAGLFCALLLAIFCAPTALSQTAGAGTITGTVTDTSNALVTSATVTIKNTDTGVTASLPVNSEGLYTAPFLKPGHYTVRISAHGFATVEKSALTLEVGQKLTVDAALPPASVTSKVVVTAENPILDTQKTEVSQEISQNMVSNLPIAARNWSDFTLLTPNTTTDGSSGLVSYHGVSGLYNSNYVDGANNNQALFSEARGRAIGMPYVYSLDSIQEFQVNSATYSAEFGQAAGGQVNAVTRSGTNTVHGDLFYYLRYPSLNALDSFGKSRHNYTQAIKQQQQFGGSVGGPIKRDKLFGFFTYDGFRKVAPLAYSSTANLLLTPSGATSNTSTITPTQCPASVSTTQCSDAIKYLQSLSGVFPRVGKQDIFFPRLDYQINDKNRVFADFNFANYKLPNGYSSSPSYTNLSVTANGNTYYHERFFVTQWTSTLTPRSVNNLLFQWGRDLETAGANASGPSVSISGVQQYGMPNALPREAEPDEHRYQITDTFSHSQGRHEWKVGGEANLVHEVMINLFQGGGIYSYLGTPAAAFQNWVQDVYQVTPTTGSAGYHYTSFTQVYDPITHVGKDDFWMKDPDWYFEDTWKVTPRFTANLGVRYDLQITPNPTHPNTTSDLATYYTQKLKTPTDRIVPRIGFAWNPRNGTVLRGGYGVFAALTQGSTYYAMRVENGVYQTNYNFNCSSANSNCVGLAGAPEFPNVLFTPPGPALAAPFSGAATPAVTPGGKALVSSFHGLDPNFVPPIAHEAQLTLEQQVGPTAISLGYVGTRALHLPIFIDTNLAKASTTRTYNIYDKSGAQSGSIILPWYTQRLTTADGSINTGFSAVSSWYNSLVGTVRQPMRHGLELLLNYTFSKTTDFGQVGGQFGTFYGSNFPIDPYNIKGERGLSDLNQTHRFVGSVVYAPQMFHSLQNNVARYALDGWSISGITTDASGFPITAFMSANAQGALDGGLTGGTMSSSSGLGSPGRAPQVGRNVFKGPGFNDLDMRISRSFPIHEKVSFQFLAEAFNLLNHPNVLSVATTGYFYVAPGKSSGGVACPSVAGSGASNFNGCIVPEVAPYTSSPLGTPTSTSGVLYTERQLQFSGKIFF